MELETVAFCIFWLFMKMLHLLVPFKSVGTIIITTFRMILVDILKWLNIYLFTLVGFATSSYVLVIAHHLQEGRAEMDAGDANVFAYINQLFLLTMGDTSQGSVETDALEVLKIGFLLFNTLLLLNLLIAMMTDTYSGDKSTKGPPCPLPAPPSSSTSLFLRPLPPSFPSSPYPPSPHEGKEGMWSASIRMCSCLCLCLISVSVFVYVSV